MARNDNLKNYLTDIATAIRNKTGTTEEILASEFDDKIRGISTGTGINGIIEEYKVASGNNISAGSFVKFVNDYGTQGLKNDLLLDSIKYSGNIGSAVALSENSVFIAYQRLPDNNNSINYPYGVVCTIEGDTITVGSIIKLSIYTCDPNNLSVVMLSSNKVFVAFVNSNGEKLYGVVCTISLRSISAGSEVTIAQTSIYTYKLSIIPLSSTKVFIAYADTSKYFTGIICDINGRTITANTPTKLDSVALTNLMRSSISYLTNGKVFIAYSSGVSSAPYLYGIVCTINGSTITAGTRVHIGNLNYISYSISTVSLSSSKVFIAHSDCIDYEKDRHLCGIVCTINGTVISINNKSILSMTNNTGRTISATKLSADKVLIVHSGSDNGLYGTSCIITNNSSIKMESDFKILEASGRR